MSGALFGELSFGQFPPLQAINAIPLQLELVSQVP